MTSSWREEARRFQQDLDAVADVNWWHPAWQAVAWGSAILNRSHLSQQNTQAMQMFRSANGGPESDTFMACPARCGGALTSRVARAVTAAVATVEQLEILQARLPGQTLRTYLQWEDGWLNPRLLDRSEASNVVFITPRGPFLARAAPARDEALALDLCRLLSEDRLLPPTLLRPIDQPSRTAVRATVAVSLFRHTAPEACHLHRSGWSLGGGPWLGIGETEDLQIVSTCHRAIEGFGHALLADRIFHILEDRAPFLEKRLKRTAPAKLDAPLEPLAPAYPGPVQLGWTTRLITRGTGHFVHQAYAMGRALDKFYSRDGLPGSIPKHFTPTFHVPVAPVSATGQVQRDTLIRHGLLSVRKQGNDFESLEEFGKRLRQWLARERRGEGLLTRLVVANATSLLPRPLKLRLLQSRRKPSVLQPPIEVLSGRGRLSIMRFPAEDRPSSPLYALAAPALFPTSRDPRGGQALTLIYHQDGCTVTLAGSGFSQTNPGAEEFLDLWLEELSKAVG